MRNKIFSVATLLFCLSPLASYAHGVHGNGFVSGFTHPILGFDHAYALLGAGVLGAIAYKGKWYVPALVFVVGMIIGGHFGIGHEATFFIEKVIAFSILALGLTILFHQNINLIVASILTLIFGLFHGYAHGAEMPEGVNILGYIGGYALGAIVMGLAGGGIIKSLANKSNIAMAVKLAGGIFIGLGTSVLLS